MKKTMIVCPVANEESSISDFIDELLRLPYDNLYLYFVMDAYSKDNTEKIIRSYELQTPHVKCVYHKQSNGVASCYLYGFKQALLDGAEYIIEMDGGGSHQPSSIPQFITNLENGYDCVWGSRFIKGGGISHHPLYRRLLSSGGTILANLILGTKLKDMTSGFDGFQRHVLADMDLDNFLSRGHMYQTEMRFYCRKYKSVEVPIHYIGGESSLKFKSVTDALQILFRLRSHEKKVHRTR